MKHSEALNELATALVAAQAEMPVIPKSAQGHGYKYADHAVILDKVKPVLKKHGLAIFQAGGGEDEPVETTIIHKSGQFISGQLNMPTIDENKRMNGAQAVGATITYGRRYGIAAALNLSIDEDTDAHHGSTTQAPAKGNSTEPKQRAGGELLDRMKAAAKNLTEERQQAYRDQYTKVKGNATKLTAMVEAMEAEAAEFKDQPPFETNDSIAAAVFDGEVVDAKGDLF